MSSCIYLAECSCEQEVSKYVEIVSSPGEYKDEFFKALMELLKAPVATCYNHCSPVCVCASAVYYTNNLRSFHSKKLR